MSKDKTMRAAGNMQVHPVANILPKMTDDEYQALKADIAAHGLHEAIWTHQGAIIDGRHRYWACLELGIDAQTCEWDGNGSLVEFVASANVHRRHLSPSQRAMVAAAFVGELEEEARKRQQVAAHAMHATKGHKHDDAMLTEKTPGASGESREMAAKIVGTNPRYVSDAKKIQEQAPDIAELVRDGKLTMQEAKQVVKMPEPVYAKVSERLAAGEEPKEVLSETKRELLVAARVAAAKDTGQASEFMATFEPEPSNLWRFVACDDRFGIADYPGRCPGQVVANLLHLYTKLGDLVVDPFAGGGTTIDVCRAMGRECKAFDLNPCRPDVQKHDAMTPLPVTGASFIFLDPPYATQKQGDYSGDENDLSHVAPDEFPEYMGELARLLNPVLADGGKVALILSSSRVDGVVYDLAFESYRAFHSAGYRCIERICVPYENAANQTGYWTENARKNRWLMRAYRDLMIFTPCGL